LPFEAIDRSLSLIDRLNTRQAIDFSTTSHFQMASPAQHIRRRTDVTAVDRPRRPSPVATRFVTVFDLHARSFHQV